MDNTLSQDFHFFSNVLKLIGDVIVFASLCVDCCHSYCWTEIQVVEALRFEISGAGFLQETCS